ncbi:MAG TPA: ATP-NAD kinase family protein [Methanoregula sp.]|nr:ATP-NAD kinase family protein [Methanoregula sp.]
MRRIGLVVNPLAGMGGSVGLKGTDGNEAEARARGARPGAGERAKAALEALTGVPGLHFVTCSGAMGEDIFRKAGIFRYEIVYRYSGESTAQDTRNAVRAFLDTGVDLVLFCGGDGTARDVYDVTGKEVPILGIPAGVKMYSAVFAVDPCSAAAILSAPEGFALRDAEIMDIDEESYRRGTLRAILYGIARIPTLPGMTQLSKQVFEEADEDRARAEIARFIGEVMLPDTLYILGAGSTIEAVARCAGIPKTLLGIDAVKNGMVVAADADERTLLALTEKEERIRIIVSPIGAQGFIVGRGNQQISARIVKRAGVGNVIVVATPHKLRETPVLYVDTGDPALDAAFGTSIQVISGYRIAQRKKIFHPGCG